MYSSIFYLKYFSRVPILPKSVHNIPNTVVLPTIYRWSRLESSTHTQSGAIFMNITKYACMVVLRKYDGSKYRYNEVRYIYVKILLDGGRRTRRHVPGHYEHGVIERYLFTVHFTSFLPVHGIVKSVSAFSRRQCGNDRRDGEVFRRRGRHGTATTTRRSETATKTRPQHNCMLL